MIKRYRVTLPVTLTVETSEPSADPVELARAQLLKIAPNLQIGRGLTRPEVREGDWVEGVRGKRSEYGRVTTLPTTGRLVIEFADGVQQPLPSENREMLREGDGNGLP